MLKEFWIFGVKEARACIFAGSFFVLLFLSNYLPLGNLARYDFLFLAALAIQFALVYFKLETKDEAKVILLFHLIGLVLEIFKTHPAIGSWSYPEAGFFKVMDVPLYSGFMYAAVGSYLSQAWKIFDVNLTKYPSYWLSVPLSALIYLNFFTHHFVSDFRWWLGAAVFIIFARTTVEFVVIKKVRKMPLPLAFVLIAFFIWIAENISTYFGAWKYPDQLQEWQLVHISKISSWALLVIISFIIVADLKHLKQSRS